MKRYETIIEGLYEAFKNTRCNEFQNGLIKEYCFDYDSLHYKLIYVTVISPLKVDEYDRKYMISFGRLYRNGFKKESTINVKYSEKPNNIKNIFEYYVKYIISKNDETLYNEIITDLINKALKTNEEQNGKNDT